MNSWQRWVQAPQTNKFRRVLFQVHLWLGIGFGLYILMISVTGSAVVLRPQFSQWFVRAQVASTAGEALAGVDLDQAVAAAYSEFTVTSIQPPRREGRATYVVLEKNGEEHTRYFDHYAGTDLGSTYPWQVRTVEWLTRLHDDLLLERSTGRLVNGIGGILFLVMTLTGLVIWWQGRRRWRDGLLLRRASAHSFMFQLHSFIGFWTLLLMLVWALTAIYFAFPAPFDYLIDAMDNDLEDFERPDGWLRFLLNVHFGRFRGYWPGLSYIWIVLGLMPAVMFISGFVLWYRRVVRRWLRQE